MEKTAPDYPNEPAERDTPGSRIDGSAPAAAPWYASDGEEPRAVMPPAGSEPVGEDDDEDDPFAQEPQAYGPEPAADSGAQSPQPGQATGKGHIIREVVVVVLTVAVVVLLFRSAVRNFKVEGESMLPTLQHEQYLLINQSLYARYDANFLGRLFDSSAPPDMRYLFQQPQRGDIVVFESPTEPRAFIKRVVAVEGETVEVRPDFNPVGRPGEPCGGCGVYVNGALLDEPYVRQTPDYQVQPALVPPGHVFVLGDNRRNSSDSHIFGPLPVGRVVGVAFMSYWPAELFGFLPPPTYAETTPAAQP